MLPGRRVSRAKHVWRAIMAIVFVLVFAIWMVGRSTNTFNGDPVVHVKVPSRVGLISVGAPVRYHGVKIGEIGGIDAGTDSSRANLRLSTQLIDSVPANVIVRVLPRTFFGDIYLQLVLPEGVRPSSESLAGGDEIGVDAGPDAVNLYDIFAKMSSLVAEVQPEKMTVALAAVNKAIGGRGAELGLMIDEWTSATKQLEDSVNDFIDATPQFRRVAESIRRATPAITETLASVTSLSHGIVEHRDALASLLSSAAGYLGEVGPFLADQRANVVTIIDSTGEILSTVAENPRGIATTFTEANAFAQSGAKVFSLGRFNITAVPTFAQPMPYTAADCPHYGSLSGTECFGRSSESGVGPIREQGESNGTVLDPPRRQSHPTTRPASSTTNSGPVIDGVEERPALGTLQVLAVERAHGEQRPVRHVGTPGIRASQPRTPNPATVLMLGPMVRGAQVGVR